MIHGKTVIRGGSFLNDWGDPYGLRKKQQEIYDDYKRKALGKVFGKIKEAVGSGKRKRKTRAKKRKAKK